MPRRERVDFLIRMVQTWLVDYSKVNISSVVDYDYIGGICKTDF